MLVFTVFLINNFVYSQSQECGTKPLTKKMKMKLSFYKNKNLIQKLEDSLALLRTAKSNKYIEDVAFKIPLAICIYKKWDGTPGGTYSLPNAKHIQKLIDEANFAFRYNGASIRFYLSEIRFLQQNINFTEFECGILGGINRRAKALNLHIVSSISDGDGGFYDGLTPMYIPNVSSAVFLVRRVYATAPQNIKVFSHEIGHYFGLNHPFIHTEDGWWTGTWSGFRAEPVTREKFWTIYPYPGYFAPCTNTGDEFCDTPADPKIGTHGNIINVSGNPVWNPATGLYRTDRYGDVFSPDLRNYMTYENRLWRDHFSDEQVSWMHSWVNLFFNFSFYDNYFDIYEPDDEKTTARSIDFNLYQTRTLHNRKLGLFNNNIPDFDFIKFTINANDALNSYKLNIRALPDMPKVNVKVKIRNSSDVVIYESSTNNYNLENLLPKLDVGDYTIEIMSLSYYNTSICKYGYYAVMLEKCVSENKYRCRNVEPGETYRIAATNYVQMSNSSCSFIAESGSQVYAKAGKKIVMKSGFKAKAGSFFNAHISTDFSCDDNSEKAPYKIQDIPYFVKNRSNQKIKTDCNCAKTKIQDIETGDIITVKPNPNNGIFTIYLKNNEIINSLRVYSISGNIILNKSLKNNNIDIDIRNYPSGIYLVKVQTINKIYTSKIIYY